MVCSVIWTPMLTACLSPCQVAPQLPLWLHLSESGCPARPPRKHLQDLILSILLIAPLKYSWLHVNLLLLPLYPLSAFATTLRWQSPWSRKISSWLPHHGLAHSVGYYKCITIGPDLALCTYSNHMECNTQGAQAVAQSYLQQIRRRYWRGKKESYRWEEIQSYRWEEIQPHEATVSMKTFMNIPPLITFPPYFCLWSGDFAADKSSFEIHALLPLTPANSSTGLIS